MSTESDALEAVFRITFGCGNCGDEWTREYAERTKVVEAETGRVMGKSVDCDGGLGDHCDCCDGTLRCETCGLVEFVTIEDREPIEDGVTVRYLVAADCPHCGERQLHGETAERPVALDRSVGVSEAYCGHCGRDVAAAGESHTVGEWDVVEEHRVERVPPLEEVRGGGAT